MVGGFVLDYLLNRTQLQARAALLQRERHEVHGAPSTRSAIDTERHRHGAPSTRSAIDTERHRHGAPSTRSVIDPSPPSCRLHCAGVGGVAAGVLNTNGKPTQIPLRDSEPAPCVLMGCLVTEPSAWVRVTDVVCCLMSC
jgi:hypothetical protein